MCRFSERILILCELFRGLPYVSLQLDVIDTMTVLNF